jgi:HEAT repeat protein
VEALRRALRDPAAVLQKGDSPLAKEYMKLSASAEKDKFISDRYDRIVGPFAQAVHGLSQLRQAAVLQEWPVRYEGMQADQRIVRLHDNLIQRLIQETRTILKTGPEEKKLAALTMTSQTALQVGTVGSPSGMGRTLEPDVIGLMKPEQAARVRESAARTLGEMFPDPERAAGAFGKLLDSELVGDRRAAMAGLDNLVRPQAQPRTGQDPMEINQVTIMHTGTAVLPLVDRGLADADPVVRRNACEAIRHMAQAVLVYIPRTGSYQDTVAEREKPRKAWIGFLPLLEVMKGRVRALSRNLNDLDVEVCLAKNAALEEVANVRLELIDVLGLGPTAPAAQDPLRDSLRAAAPAAAKLLDHADVRVRLAALYALESLATEAVPAIDGLFAASKDKNSFVRWGVARVLGKIAPAEGIKAVPALAALAEDENGDVRFSAVDSLRRYGPAAAPAVPALARMTKHTNQDLRRLAIQALRAIGPKAEPAIPELILALGDKDGEVRSAAAGTLGAVGVSTPAAVEALVKALDDSAPGVRVAASDALLSLK